MKKHISILLSLPLFIISTHCNAMEKTIFIHNSDQSAVMQYMITIISNITPYLNPKNTIPNLTHMIPHLNIEIEPLLRISKEESMFVNEHFKSRPFNSIPKQIPPLNKKSCSFLKNSSFHRNNTALLYAHPQHHTSEYFNHANEYFRQ